MKKNKINYFLVNNVLIGVDTIVYMLYMTIIMMAGVASFFVEYAENEVAEKITRLSYMSVAATGFVVFILVVLMLLNHYFYKNKNNAMLKILSILLVMGFVVIAVRTAIMFI